MSRMGKKSASCLYVLLVCGMTSFLLLRMLQALKSESGDGAVCWQFVLDPPHKPCFSYFLIYCADYTLSCLFNAFAHCTTVMAVLSYCLYTKREDGAIFIFIKWKETIKKSGLVCCSLSPKCTVVHVIVRTCMNNARAHVCVRML